jgi:hypothetical protein
LGLARLGREWRAQAAARLPTATGDIREIVGQPVFVPLYNLYLRYGKIFKLRWAAALPAGQHSAAAASCMHCRLHQATTLQAAAGAGILRHPPACAWKRLQLCQLQGSRLLVQPKPSCTYMLLTQCLCWSLTLLLLPLLLQLWPQELHHHQ